METHLRRIAGELTRAGAAEEMSVSTLARWVGRALAGELAPRYRSRRPRGGVAIGADDAPGAVGVRVEPGGSGVGADPVRELYRWHGVDTGDVEAARRLVNELPRERGPSAEELWTGRRRVAAQERDRFLEVYRAELVRRAEPVELPENLLAPSERIGAILARGAAVAALRELGHVQTRRRPEAAED